MNFHFKLDASGNRLIEDSHVFVRTAPEASWWRIPVAGLEEWQAGMEAGRAARQAQLAARVSLAVPKQPPTIQELIARGEINPPAKTEHSKSAEQETPAPPSSQTGTKAVEHFNGNPHAKAIAKLTGEHEARKGARSPTAASKRTRELHCHPVWAKAVARARERFYATHGHPANADTNASPDRSANTGPTVGALHTRTSPWTKAIANANNRTS